MDTRLVSSRIQLLSAVIVPALLLYGGPLQAQDGAHRVSGVVTSSQDFRPLSGAQIVVKGTTIGTLTGTNGRFTLDAPSPTDTLVISFLGYGSREVPIDGRSIVNVEMTVQAIVLQELVAVGYGTQQKRDVTGAVTTLDAEDLTDLPSSANVESTLQGRVPGVQVAPVSGEPGADAVIRVRGIGTLNDASPLFVVDGMLLNDISFLNAKDIASVDVLKDASATAIYGSRGANGVIIITTKRGVTDRPTRFTFRTYVGSQSVLNDIDLVNGQQYAMLTDELANNLNPGEPTPFGGVHDTVSVNTDWQDVIFESAPLQSYALSAAGGTEEVKYYFSADLHRQAGVVPHSDFNRLTLRLNNDYNLTDHFLLGHNIAFSYTEGDGTPGLLGQVYQADPTVQPRDATGSFNDAGVHGASGGNPAATLFYTRNEKEGSRLVGNIFAELNVLGKVTLRSSFGLDHDRSEFKNFVPVFVVSPQQQNLQSRVDVSTETRTTWLWENTLTYNYVADRHRVTALAGITAQSTYGENLGCSRQGIPGESETQWFCSAGEAASQTNNNDPLDDWRMLSYLFRTNYAYKDRYLLTASLRIDGSSRFGEDNRYGTFPSFALGWVVSDEEFLQGKEVISALKLRLSWGKIGNDKIGNYPAVTLVDGNLNAVFGRNEDLLFGATIRSLANPLVHWEETGQWNFGADMAFLDGRLQGTLDYYRRTTDGILVDVPIPAHVGVVSDPIVNAAEVLNHGLEGSFNWSDTWGPVRYELGFNGTTINNEVKALGEGRTQPIFGGGLGALGNVTRTVVGQPIGCFWGYQVEGVFQTQTEIDNSPNRGVGEVPGDLRFADLNGDGVITGEDQTYLGCPNPDFIYGFHTRMNWGRFDFSAAFSGQAGNKIVNGKKAFRFGNENFETTFLDRWNGPGTSNTEPRLTTAGHNYISSTRFIEDGSFLKLQNASIGYRLPASWTRSIRASDARIYVSGTNLFQSTDYTGFSPEIVTEDVINTGIDRLSTVFPPARTFTVGLDLTF